ncbi:MAG: hypothetical protein F4X00_16350 [Gemmatimonadetes bacterium]|nr:hypothetical protein [Gemmatimonadota bacterium]
MKKPLRTSAGWTPSALVFAPALAFTACAVPEDPPAEAPLWAVGAEPLVTYGSAGDDPDNEFGYVADVARGPDGTIAAADGLYQSLSFFTAEGELRARAGREGEGPGEFSEISGLVSTPEGRLFALDGGLQRLSEWTFDGDYVGDTRLTRQGTDRPIGGVGRFGDGSWYARERDEMVAAPMNGTARDTAGFFRLADGAVGEPLARAPGTITAMFEMMGPAVRHALLSPRSVGVVRGGCLLVGATDDPVLGVVDTEGNHLGEVRLDVEVKQATGEHRDEWVAQTLATSGAIAAAAQRPMLERLADAIPMAERVPFGYGLVADALGYIWVQRYHLPEGPGGSEWHVFTETGAALGTVILPGGFRAVEISADEILGVFTHEMGLEDVRVYALDRGGDVGERPGLPGCG